MKCQQLSARLIHRLLEVVAVRGYVVAYAGFGNTDFAGSAPINANKYVGVGGEREVDDVKGEVAECANANVESKVGEVVVEAVTGAVLDWAKDQP